MLSKTQQGSFRQRFKAFIILTRVFICIVIFTIGAGFEWGFAPGVITELKFNEGTGTITSDVSGNAHNGTLVNGPTWGAGKYGQGINFDGTNDYVNIADHNNFTLDPAQSYSWSAWVKNNNFNQWGTVWSQTLSSTSFFYFYAHSSTNADAGPVTNGVSVFWWNGANRLVAHSTNNALTLGQWSHIAIIYNASQPQNNRFTIYVNGADVTVRNDVVSAGTITTINPTNIRIGSNQPFGEYLNGSIDEVRYYRRLLSLAEVQSDMNIGNVTDSQSPAVNITSPAAGTVSGTINLTANAVDNTGVTGVQFLLDGNNLGPEDLTSPYSVSWNTMTATNGGHSLTARARDAAGNTTVSAAVVINVNNDITPPTVSLTPLQTRNVSGTITLSASASDNLAVAGVQFLLNGANLGAEDFTSPYSILWNTRTVPNGNYTLTARARDAAGNTATSTNIGVTVNNDTQLPIVNITAPAAGNVSGGITVTANASDNIGVAGVQFLLNGTNLGAEDQTAPYSVSWNTLTAANSNHTLTARARDIAGNTATSAGVIVTVNNDAVQPTVTITEPAAGNVSGTINVSANASDNTGVAGVQFMLDGVNLGAEDISAPFTLSWNTENTANGNHTLTAKARDAAGNTATSAGVNVNIVPDFSFTLITPVKNVEVTGSTDFRINVSYLNGFTSSNVALGVSGLPANTTSHYLFNPMSHQGETQLFINTSNAAPGTYTLTLTALAEGITHTQQATLNITATVDFMLTASPAIQNVARGNATTFTINLNETNDFVNPVTLSVLGLPAGVTASLNPASPVPATTSTLTLIVATSAAPGTYNLTVQGVSGAITRTVPITLTITTAQSLWTVTTIGSTGVPNNTVRVGHLRTDGLERIYIGTIATGRMLEYSWNGSSWTGPLDVGGSPSGQEIHNCTIGPGRGDGKERMYIASYDFNIYEIWHDETGWHQMTVGTVGNNLGMHTVVGVGRNDGVTRIYAASTQQLYEFTWNGTSWNRILIGNTPGAHELALGNGRRNGNNYIYIASISSGNFEARWTGTAWTIASMGDNGDARGLELGDGRNDGIIRVYSALYDGRIREFTWNGTAWTFVNMPMAGTQNIHAYIVPGRNDGINRIYTDNANGKVFEYTWNGTSWGIYNMGGGSDYMYGLHYGTARNDGVIRFYGADRGSVNRVYEFTWQAPNPLVKFRKDNGNSYTIKRRLY